jgi:hypothetical protein
MHLWRSVCLDGAILLGSPLLGAHNRRTWKTVMGLIVRLSDSRCKGHMTSWGRADCTESVLMLSSASKP